MFGAKKWINTKVIKILVTGGTNLISKIVEKYLTMKISPLCRRYVQIERSFDTN